MGDGRWEMRWEMGDEMMGGDGADSRHMREDRRVRYSVRSRQSVFEYQKIWSTLETTSYPRIH